MTLYVFYTNRDIQTIHKYQYQAIIRDLNHLFKNYRIFIVIYIFLFTYVPLSKCQTKHNNALLSYTHTAVFYTTTDWLHVYMKWGTSTRVHGIAS